MRANNGNAKDDKTPVRSSKSKCSSCENYKKHIREPEPTNQTTSNHAIAVQRLQEEITRIENERSKSIIDHENLMKVHRTTLQELAVLKGNYKKLEEENATLRSRENEKISQRKQNVLQATVQTDILSTGAKCIGTTSTQPITKQDLASKLFGDVERNGKNFDYMTILEDVNHQIGNLNASIAKLEREHAAILMTVSQLKNNQKQMISSLYPEENHSSTGNVPFSLNNPSTANKEPTKLKTLEVEQKLESMTREKNQMKSDLDDCKEHVCRLKEQLVQKQVQYSELATQSEIQQTEERKRELKSIGLTTASYQSDSYDSLTTKQETAVKRSESTTKADISNLEKKLEEYRVKLISYEQQTPSTSRDDAESQNAMLQLRDRIIQLEGELKELSVENSEYEEENKFYVGKIESLANENRFLIEENMRIVEENRTFQEKIDALRKDYETILSQYEEEIKQLELKIRQYKHDVYLASEEDQEE